MITQFLSFTSPIKFITLAQPGIGRRFSIIAIGAFKRSAKARARVTPPRSGETTTTSSRFLAWI